jgi:hypothetical protein
MYLRVQCVCTACELAADDGDMWGRVCMCIQSLNPFSATLHPALCLHIYLREFNCNLLLVMTCRLCTVPLQLQKPGHRATVAVSQLAATMMHRCRSRTRTTKVHRRCSARWFIRSRVCLSQLAMQQRFTTTCCKQPLPMALAAHCMLLLLLQFGSSIIGNGQLREHSLLSCTGSRTAGYCSDNSCSS